MMSYMKKFVLLFLCLGFVLTASAQRTDGQARLFDAKLALMKSELGIGEKQMKTFAPLYARYENDIASASGFIRNYRVKPHGGGASDQTLTREEAVARIDATFKVSQSILDIKRRYLTELSKVLSPEQLVKFFQTESEIRNKLNKELKRRNDQ